MLFLVSYCGDLYPIIKIVKLFINFIHYVVPIVLILLISLDFIKGVFTNSEEEAKKSQGIAVKRLIYAVAIFLVVTIVTFVMDLVADAGVSDLANNPLDIKSWKACWKCKSKDECESIDSNSSINVNDSSVDDSKSSNDNNSSGNNSSNKSVLYDSDTSLEYYSNEDETSSSGDVKCRVGVDKKFKGDDGKEYTYLCLMVHRSFYYSNTDDTVSSGSVKCSGGSSKKFRDKDGKIYKYICYKDS